MGAAAPRAEPGHSGHDAVVSSMRHDGLDLLRVLQYCPWEQRAAVAMLSHEVRQKLGHGRCGDLAVTTEVEQQHGEAEDGAFHWRFLCQRLAEEHNVHVPLPAPGRGECPPPAVASSWRALFLELFAIRHRLDGLGAPEDDDPEQAEGEQPPPPPEQFKIDVAARFRAAIGGAGEEEEQAVILPLHQKVQIVRDRYGCSRKEAMMLIMRERGKCSLDDPFQNAEVVDENKENVEFDQLGESPPAQEAVKPSSLRSLLNQEEDVEVEPSDDESGDEDDEVEACAPRVGGAADAHVSILAVQEDVGSVLAVAPGVGLRDFRFDRVLGDKARQADAYDFCAQRLVMDFLNGVNGSIICYGQTGSGKTYTMFGPPCRASEQEQGVVPRACEEVLRSMHDRRERGTAMELGLSYVEVFGSEVSDLLRQGRVVGQGRDGRYGEVRATDRVGHRYVLDGHTECVVESWEEVQALLESGNEAKRKAATAMNERSTRAHTLLVLTLTQTTPSGYQVRSRLFLADLGGSEKVSKSKADAGLAAPVTMVGGVEVDRVSWREYYQRRKRIQETQHINAGLFALKKVIEALHTRSEMRESGTPSHLLPYVPYQDSKLTMLLKDALGGTSRTLVLCTASMDQRHAPESLQTLRFGERCSQVRKRGAADTAASVQIALRQLEVQIKAVEAEIVRKERWETKLIRRRDVDTVAGAFGAQYGSILREEVIPTSVLVGAEQEREELERLLQRQLELQGLGGMLAKDYRDMRAQEADDGGKGQDFRAKDRFRRNVKAKDFEEEVVVAEALRFFFRRADAARKLFGETQETIRKRVFAAGLHDNYFTIARWLREQWEESAVAGREKRSFGKTMLDLTQEWRAAFKTEPRRRDEVLAEIVGKIPQLREEGAS